LAGAREILTAAGVTYKMEDDSNATRGLPTALDVGLAWALREGVTNVVRHGQAHSCTIRLSRGANEITLEILNDSRQMHDAHAPARREGIGEGHGLRGVAERMAALGGHSEAGPWGAGFRLRASLPLGRDDPRAEATSTGASTGSTSALIVTPTGEPAEKEQEP
jgi:two-component system sensor histidine kinase DesK